MSLYAPYYAGGSPGVGVYESVANDALRNSRIGAGAGANTSSRDLLLAALSADPSQLYSGKNLNLINGLRSLLSNGSSGSSSSSSSSSSTTPTVPGADPTATFNGLLGSANTAASSDPYLKSVVNSIAGAGEAAGNRAARSYQARTGHGAGTAAGEGYAGLSRLMGITQGAEAANRARLGQRNDYLSSLSSMSESALNRQQQQNLAQQANNQWLLRFIIGNAFGGNQQDSTGSGMY